MDQYEIEREIDEGSSNSVVIGFHKVTKARVAIKAIECNKYHRLQNENRVSEAEAMTMCNENNRVVGFVEKFRHKGDVLLITNYAAGGDLLSYCTFSNQGKRWMSEKTARHIFV